MALNVTTAAIASGANTAIAQPSLAQWDQGQILKIEGVELPQSYQVEFSGGGTVRTVPMIGTAEGVQIPNKLLQSSHPITAHIVLHEDVTDRETEYWITIYVKPRQAPETVEIDPADISIIDQTIAAAQRAVATSTDQAEAAARSAEDAAESAEAIQDMTVDATTLTTGSEATVTKSVDPETGVVNLTFGIPEGEQGPTGQKGDKGDTGATGATGATGPQGPQGVKGDTGATPAFSIGTVSTLEPGASATASITGTSENPVLNLGIPKGAKGDTGEVTQAEFDELSGTVSNLNRQISDVDENQIPQLKSDLNSVNHSFNDGMISHGTVTAGKYIRNSDGAEGSSSNFSATDYIFIGGLESVYIANPSAGNLNYNAFYDAGKNFISNFRVPATLVKLTVPSNAVYMRLSDITSRMQSFSVITPLAEDGNGCTIDIFNEGTIKIGSLKNGTYINRDTGAESISADYACTNYLNIKGLSKIVVYYQTANGQRYNFFYDENLSGISGSSFIINSGYNIVDVPSGACFVRLSETQTNIATLKIFVPMLYKINQLDDVMTNISAEVSRISPIVESGIGEETIINSLSEYSTHNGIVDYDNTWYQYNNSNYKHVAVPISGTRNIVKITAGTHATRIMGLTSYIAPTSSSHDMNIGQYWVRRIEIDAGQSFEGLIPDDVNYLAINTLYGGENCVSSFELTSLNYEAGTTQKEYTSNLYRVTASAQNVRDFSDGSGEGCLDNLVSTNLPLWKSFVSSWMNTDFLTMTEWFPYFDRSHTIDAYEEIFEQFYPYKYEIPTANPVRIILSKHKCLFMNLNDIVNVGFGLPMLVCNIAGQSVAVVCWLQSNTDPASTRIQAYENAITALAQYDKVIVMGDFNTEQGLEELSTWTDAGYTLGNGGYWGEIKTWDDTTPNDNIVTKGFIYEYFEKGDKVTSDHSAVRAKLSFNG